MVENESLVGQRIGIYTVLSECERSENYDKHKDRHKLYLVQCNICGHKMVRRAWDIRNVRVCKHTNEYTGELLDHNIRWGSKRLFRVFCGMKFRCYHSSCSYYENYGGKGVKVCEEWLRNPMSFKDWAMSHGYTDDLTIDRIDPDGDYCPENCRWISREENTKWKSTTSRITVNGETMTGRDWSSRLHLGVNKINEMMREHGEEITVEFIKRRLKNPNLKSDNNNSWLKVYGLK